MAYKTSVKTNHKWNILNIMRYYSRIRKPFNARVYLDFITPQSTDPERALVRSQTSLSEIQAIIRRHISNKWCQRVGDNVVITQKGINALVAYEKTKYTKEANVSEETLRRRRRKTLEN